MIIIFTSQVQSSEQLLVGRGFGCFGFGWVGFFVWFVSLVFFFYNQRNQNMTQVYRNRNQGSTPGPEDQLMGQLGSPSTLQQARLRAG